MSLDLKKISLVHCAEKKTAPAPARLAAWCERHGYPVVATLEELPPEIRRAFLSEPSEENAL